MKEKCKGWVWKYTHVACSVRDHGTSNFRFNQTFHSSAGGGASKVQCMAQESASLSDGFRGISWCATKVTPENSFSREEVFCVIWIVFLKTDKRLPVNHNKTYTFIFIHLPVLIWYTTKGWIIQKKRAFAILKFIATQYCCMLLTYRDCRVKCR